MPTNFIDAVTLHVAAGDGGNGCSSVRREKFKPLAGPDGSRGGNGGSIFLEASQEVTTLLEFHRRPHQRADHGGFGMGDYRQGADGEDVTLRVPVGTIVRDAKGTLLSDMQTPGDRLLIAEGGLGGLGNMQLAGPKRKAPGFALLGTKGFVGDITLELKTVADVALVGFPSAGKSSLIAAISAARPKIADYPFTTLAPNLGVVQAGDIRFTVADVPGLIPGASEGKGLGLEFLRHIERCSVIVHVIDCATLEPHRDPLTDFEEIQHELAAYEVPIGDVPLIERPQLIALNKIDVPEARELADFMTESFTERGFKVFEISTLSHAGLQPLLYAMASLVDTHRKAEAAARENIVPVVVPKRRTNEKPFVIENLTIDGEPAFRIVGAKPERWVEQTDFINDEAVGYLGDRLAKIGVEEALAKHGAHAGDTVVIGAGDDPVVFDWEPTIASVAEAVAPRGSDPRLDDHRPRRSNVERRSDYHDWMDAKSAAREQLETEREAGIWSSSDASNPDAEGEDR